ncbi:TonB-dependent receptor [Segetibacter sp. 3557_3]|uniref:TonB-dependent receptor domain-containing protein n=1 Tax=Segetibacter sp. 3557_3 TaxID=2547429 RepID=UPI0010583FD7|nr:TonB-dependent receptor [Segetibacter sp. 3557_3]TDH21336.1 TonB-dependent receptor [Segetibacter sp. 3557_3]
MKRFFCLTLTVFLASSGFGQGAPRISGLVIGKDEKTIAGATISLLRAKDSATLKLSAANKDGAYFFENVNTGNFLLAATAVGYKKSYSKIFTLDVQQNLSIPTIRLTPTNKDLAGVTVTATRPLVEQKIDRTIVNVEASITNIGTSALEVLEKAPGVSVDRDGNISLKGKEGVMIMIDGRPTQLGGADLANLLRNLNSNQMDQVEIMTNPPARYDAAGGAGIINIKTKKNISAGYNGSATLGVTQGRYPKTNEALNLNYRNGKINVFTNLSHNYRKSFGTLKINRNIISDNTSTIDKVFNQQADRISEGNSYNAKVGVDYFVSKKTTLGIVAGATSSPNFSTNKNVTNISNALKNLESITMATVNNDGVMNSFSTNLNFRTQLNNKGREITSDIDFLGYTSAVDQYMVNSYTDAAGRVFRKADTLNGDLPQDIQVYSGRVDYVHPLKKNAKFEAGVKSGIVRTDNNANYDSVQYGRIVHDFNRSNHFIYQENINAAYVNYSTPLSKKISAQLGLRLENTIAKGKQLTTGEDFNRNYIQLFPTAYFQYKANEKNSFGANFGRRVRRPNYQSLNPFIRFIDRYTYSQGNPNLKPSLSNNIELTHTWKNQITTTLNYTSTKDIIEGVIEQKGQEAYTKPSNIASLEQIGLAVNANNPITKWWTSTMNVNVFNNRYKGIVSNASVNFAATSFVVTGTQQFKINKTLTAEINGRFRNGWLEGVMRAKPVGFVGAGVGQQVLKNQGTLRLSIRDIFYTQRFRGVGKYGNVDFDFQEIAETRVISLSFSYRFSKGKKIAPVKRTVGSANEEQERIGQ